MKNGKKSVDNEGTFGALLTDLWKDFDSIPYELLIAKLTAYRFDLKALKFVYSYINNRKKKLEQMKNAVDGESCFLEYHKDLFFIGFSLLYFYVIYIILRSILMLLVMLIATPHKVPIMILKTQFKVLNLLQHDYLIGLSKRLK